MSLAPLAVRQRRRLGGGGSGDHSSSGARPNGGGARVGSWGSGQQTGACRSGGGCASYSAPKWWGARVEVASGGSGQHGGAWRWCVGRYVPRAGGGGEGAVAGGACAVGPTAWGAARQSPTDRARARRPHPSSSRRRHSTFWSGRPLRGTRVGCEKGGGKNPRARSSRTPLSTRDGREAGARTVQWLAQRPPTQGSLRVQPRLST